MKDIISVLTNHSMKAFNCVRDPPSDETLRTDTSINKLYSANGVISLLGEERIRDFTTKLFEYATNSPVLDRDLVIYSGRSRADYEKIRDSDKSELIMNRFLSGTFDKEFANRYAFIRNNQSSKKGLTSHDDDLIVFQITVPAGLRNIFYVEQENQIYLDQVLNSK